MNVTIDESGLVPYLLTFGIIPRFPIIKTNLLTQKDRMKALSTAQMEMSAITAEWRITSVLTKNLPSSVDATHQVGDKALLYRETPD